MGRVTELYNRTQNTAKVRSLSVKCSPEVYDSITLFMRDRKIDRSTFVIAAIVDAIEEYVRLEAETPKEGN